MNKPENSNINLNDSSILDVHSNSCYNYFSTNKVIKDEDFQVTFETNIIKTDGYFYFGVCNSSLVCNSSCMCCGIGNVTYITSTGNVREDGGNVNYPSLCFNSGNINTISIKVMGKQKKVYFTVNEKKEEGPFNLTGDNWKVVSGACNSANGTIKIVSSIIV